jgi:N-methylhydantoinase A
MGELDTLARELLAELETRIDDAELRSSAVREAAADIRYVGQEHCLTIGVAMADGGIAARASALEDDFHAEFRRVFGVTMDDEVEVVALRVALRNVLPEITAQPAGGDRAAPSPNGAAHRAWSFTENAWMPFALVARDDLSAGQAVSGPALVLEPTTTTYVDAGWTCRAHESGTLRLSVGP